MPGSSLADGVVVQAGVARSGGVNAAGGLVWRSHESTTRALGSRERCWMRIALPKRVVFINASVGAFARQYARQYARQKARSQF